MPDCWRISLLRDPELYDFIIPRMYITTDRGYQCDIGFVAHSFIIGKYVLEPGVNLVCPASGIR